MTDKWQCNGCGAEETTTAYGYVGAFVGNSWYCSGCRTAAQNAHDAERARIVEIVHRWLAGPYPTTCEIILSAIEGGGNPEGCATGDSHTSAGEPSPEHKIVQRLIDEEDGACTAAHVRLDYKDEHEHANRASALRVALLELDGAIIRETEGGESPECVTGSISQPTGAIKGTNADIPDENGGNVPIGNAERTDNRNDAASGESLTDELDAWTSAGKRQLADTLNQIDAQPERDLVLRLKTVEPLCEEAADALAALGAKLVCARRWRDYARRVRRQRELFRAKCKRLSTENEHLNDIISEDQLDAHKP